MSLTITYLLWSLFLILLLAIVVAVWIYAKWHIYGPKWKRFKSKWAAKFGKQKDLEKAKRGAKITDPLNPSTGTVFETPQELLRQQLEDEISFKKAEQDKLKLEEKKMNRKKFIFFGKRKSQTTKKEEIQNQTKSISLAEKITTQSKSGLDWGNETPSELNPEIKKEETSVVENKEEIKTEVNIDHKDIAILDSDNPNIEVLNLDTVEQTTIKEKDTIIDSDINKEKE